MLDMLDWCQRNGGLTMGLMDKADDIKREMQEKRESTDIDDKALEKLRNRNKNEEQPDKD